MKSIKLLAATSVAAASLMTISTPAQAQSDPLLGQLMAFGGNFCPRGWANTDGQLLAISQFSALFSLLGTMYGGDGRTTFGLPELRGRAPISVGNGPGIGNYVQGSKGGSTQFTLTVNEMPAHNHAGTMAVSNMPGTSANPSNRVLAADSGADKMYLDAVPNVSLRANVLTIGNTGNSQSVNKLSPYQTLKWCIAIQGVFPSRN